MPLDIMINDNHDKAVKSIPLYLEDYDIIMEKVEEIYNFPLINKSLSNYYGESEIYLNELNAFKLELLNIKGMLDASSLETTNLFLNQFLNLIDHAIMQRKTIKLIGD